MENIKENNVAFLLNGAKKLEINDCYYDLELVTKLPKITNNLTRKMTKEELAKKRSEYGRKSAQNSPWRNYISQATAMGG